MKYKLYKTGKNLVSGAFIVAGLTLSAITGTGIVANADGEATQNPSIVKTQITDGLQSNGAGLVYYESGSMVKNKWEAIGDKTYYFGSDGQALSGLQMISTDSGSPQKYYFGSDYTLQKNTTFTINNQTYQADSNGFVSILEGLVTNNQGKSFYVNGQKVTSQWETVDGNIFYFGSDGQAVTGLQTIGNQQYYFGTADGTDKYSLQTNFDMPINGVTYHADDQGQLKPKNGTIWGFGDSTTVGWNSYNDGSQSYDAYAAKNLGKLYRNTSAYSGTQIGNDMVWMTDQAVTDNNFSQVTELVIGMGVNDINFGDGKPLNTIAQIFQDSIRRLHAANPNMKIYVLLPQGDWWQGSNNETIGSDGFSMNQLRDMLTQVANSLGIQVINAGVVTDQNHTTTLPDGVHPTNAAYQAIGEKISNVIQNNPINNYHDTYQNYDLGNVSGYVNTLAGWRWLENGLVFTGFRYYMGTYYWFVNGARQNEGWRTAWGHLYYTNADGRAVQGIYNINGQNFNFGNDGTYYMRSSGYLYDGSSQNGGYRWYENGQLFTGFRNYMGTYYWFVDGVRQNAGWRQAWGYTYYTDDNGRAVSGTQFIDGKLYDFGNDGTFFERPLSGYIWDGSSQNGGYRWYENGQLFTGFRYYMGTYYWFIDGVRQNAGWRQAWGYTYWTDQDGRAVEGHQNINGQNYYFGDNGTFYLR
ncbi:SGNH/GDSL hydrolase family protein [Fructobacillus ficulneus]|uniref:SGNH hydrolase-type esterase domain-containing protein n=1 Tax=Fructobacillus ficulneus TaxID=157463 RepID=A0A0K8MEZ4_9LACO|nr:GDSL-type esterase/lipase family protein [Fructobacillus ficulneus]GAO99101.1 hypothetical protein FFIC_010060 [Fructobacillus ficulneus]